MKACVISFSVYELDLRVRRYAEVLTALPGARVDAIALRRPEDPRRSTLNGVEVFHIQDRHRTEKNLFQFLLPYLAFFLKGSLLLLRRHLRERYDVIHVHNVPDFLVFMALVPRLLGAKVILDIHDILPEFFCQKFSKGPGSGVARALRLIERLSTNFAHHVIVANDIWRERIIQRDRLPPGRVTTLLNYPNLGYFRSRRPRPPDGRLRIIYPGTLSHLHGVDLLVDAVAAVKPEIPGIELSIYTLSEAPIQKERILRQVAALGLEGSVAIHQGLPAEELRDIFPEFDIGVVPKRGGVFADEAFSTKIFDFMAAGLPVIASRTRIDERYFDDSLILFFPPGDSGALADRIRQVFRDPASGLARAAKATRFLGENNWGTKKAIYLEVLAKIGLPGR